MIRLLTYKKFLAFMSEDSPIDVTILLYNFLKQKYGISDEKTRIFSFALGRIERATKKLYKIPLKKLLFKQHPYCIISRARGILFMRSSQFSYRVVADGEKVVS